MSIFNPTLPDDNSPIASRVCKESLASIPHTPHGRLEEHSQIDFAISWLS